MSNEALLNRSVVVDAAVEAAGANEFGEDDWIEPLDRLIDSLLADAELNEIGGHVAQATLVSSLRARLQILDWHARHPEVAETPVAAPIVVLGQPRTGTTILFDLLAQDPALRAPLTWEVAEPIPPPRTETYLTDPRIEAADASAGMAEALTPGFQAIHPGGATRAQECVTIMAAAVRSIHYSIMFRVPTYTQWLFDEADPQPMYAIHRMFLQVLQSEHAGERWVLKTPAHQWWLRELFRTYPDATAIHTHRDPLKVIASTASLGASLRRLGMSDPSIADAGAEWSEYLIEGNERALRERTAGWLRDDQVIDVHFADLMADTFGGLEQIYAQLGRPFTAEAEQAMRSFLAENPSDKHGKHTYSFADTGLDVAATRARTARYTEHFGVATESV